MQNWLYSNLLLLCPPPFCCLALDEFVLTFLQVLNVNISDHRGSNYSGGVRQYIQAHFSQRKEYQITGVRTDSYIDDMKNSKFCLSPEGMLTPSFAASFATFSRSSLTVDNY